MPRCGHLGKHARRRTGSKGHDRPRSEAPDPTHYFLLPSRQRDFELGLVIRLMMAHSGHQLPLFRTEARLARHKWPCPHSHMSLSVARRYVSDKHSPPRSMAT